MLAAGVYAEKGEYDSLFISNYLDVYVKDALKRVPGVADVMIFGERKYSMRAVARSRAAGRRASSPPATSSTRCASRTCRWRPAASATRRRARARPIQISVRAAGRLREPSEFENIIVKAGADGALVRLRDVGRAELGAETLRVACCASRASTPSASASSQLPTANALDVERGVSAELDRLVGSVPAGPEDRDRVRHDQRRRGVDPRGR